MPAEQLKAFLQTAKQDKILQGKLKSSTTMLETTLAIAKDAGFNISANDLTEMQAELEDNELENASGGGGFNECRVVRKDFSDAPQRWHPGRLLIKRFPQFRTTKSLRLAIDLLLFP